MVGEGDFTGEVGEGETGGGAVLWGAELKDGMLRPICRTRRSGPADGGSGRGEDLRDPWDCRGGGGATRDRKSCRSRMSHIFFRGRLKYGCA